MGGAPGTRVLLHPGSSGLRLRLVEVLPHLAMKLPDMGHPTIHLAQGFVADVYLLHTCFTGEIE